MEKLRMLRDQMLAQLLPGIIHEINNPLGAIIMNLSITRDDVTAWKNDGTPPDIDMMAEALVDMENASLRINEYLKALSYFCGANFLEDSTELDVPTYIRHAMALSHHQYKRVIPITFDAAVICPPLYAPPARFLLLLLFALKTVVEAKGGRPLRISVEHTDERIHIVFARDEMKIDHFDEQLVALCAQTGVETHVRESGLILAVAFAFTAARSI